MSPIGDARVPQTNRPHHHMGCAGTDFVIAARTAVGLDGPGPGYRSHFILVAVGTGLHPAQNR